MRPKDILVDPWRQIRKGPEIEPSAAIVFLNTVGVSRLIQGFMNSFSNFFAGLREGFVLLRCIVVWTLIKIDDITQLLEIDKTRHTCGPLSAIYKHIFYFK